MSFNKTKGITLIALVVTIIVLLILAGISIMMLTGNNSILNRAGEAREKTEMAQIKEKAELVKLGLQIDEWTKLDSTPLKRNALISAIHKEFEGSRATFGKVVTENDEYDILVDNELNISVVKHQKTSNNSTGEISIATQIGNNYPSAMLLVYPSLEETDEDIPSYEEYAKFFLETATSEDEIKTSIAKSYTNLMMQYGYLQPGQSLTWADIIGEENQNKPLKDALGDNYEQMLIQQRLVAIEEYMNEYGKEITVTCNNETKTTNSVMGYVYFEITESGEYTIEAIASDGSKGKTTAKVTILTITPEEVTIYEEETATLTVTGLSEEITWKSSNPSVATVENGVVTGVKKGTARITATNADETAISNSCTVTVNAPTITVDPTSVTLYDGETATLTVSGISSSKVTWTSSNTSIATVNDGTITAVGAGSATITVKNRTGTASSSCAVTVKETPKLDGAMAIKDTTAGDDTMTNAGMTTNNENIATITSEGIVKCGSETGTTEITINGETYKIVSTAKIVYTASSTGAINGTATYNNPVIPEGYSAIDTQDAKWDLEATTQPDVNKGLVIMDNDGNQFVWIPVQTPITDTEANGTNNKAMAINKGTTENPQYRGLIYNFTNANGTLSSTVRPGCTTTSNSKEPGVLTSSDYGDWSITNGRGLNLIKLLVDGYSELTNNEIKTKWANQLQTEYNDMIKSVIKYGGFYIGRYESSLINGKTKSVSNSTSMTAETASANTWYGLYQKQKNYTSISNGEKVTKGNMIYGSQCYAMLNWMMNNGIEVKYATYKSEEATRNKSRITGTQPSDKLKNIFDILGNSYEWTQEWDRNWFRVCRSNGWGASYRHIPIC